MSSIEFLRSTARRRSHRSKHTCQWILLPALDDKFASACGAPVCGDWGTNFRKEDRAKCKRQLPRPTVPKSRAMAPAIPSITRATEVGTWLVLITLPVVVSFENVSRGILAYR
jgi:hypothetical protein